MFARIATNKLVDKVGKILCMDSLGHLVLQWRTMSGLSQAELAQRVGGKVKAAHIGQLESVGNRMPRYLPDLARAMGCSVDDLLSGRLPPPIPKDASVGQGQSRARGSNQKPLSATAALIARRLDDLSEPRRALALSLIDHTLQTLEEADDSDRSADRQPSA
jgi:transcriptional regulator with XRE-family HTH domain